MPEKDPRRKRSSNKKKTNQLLLLGGLAAAAFFLLKPSGIPGGGGGGGGADADETTGTPTQTAGDPAGSTPTRADVFDVEGPAQPVAFNATGDGEVVAAMGVPQGEDVVITEDDLTSNAVESKTPQESFEEAGGNVTTSGSSSDSSVPDATFNAGSIDNDGDRGGTDTTSSSDGREHLTRGSGGDFEPSTDTSSSTARDSSDPDLGFRTEKAISDIESGDTEDIGGL